MKQQTFPTLVIEYGRLLVVFTWPFKKAFFTLTNAQCIKVYSY